MNFEDDNDLIDEVALEMECKLATDPIKKERLRKINGTNTYANSLNVFVGRQRSGKSYQALQEIIKISRYDITAHLLIYINEKGESDDETFDTFKNMIELPIVYVKYSDVIKYMQKLINYKNIYNKIKDANAERELPDKYREELFNNLYVDDFERPYLHTLVLMEDATTQKVIKDANSYVNHLLTTCAHIQCSFFVLIHFWKALTPNLKSNIYTAYIYPGYSKQQLNYILYQMNLPDTYKEVYEKYRTLKGHSKLCIDCVECNYGIL